MKRFLVVMGCLLSSCLMATPSSQDVRHSQFKTGVAATLPVIIRSQIRANDPTILDVDYIVCSGQPTVDVRALAFEDGERSFWKVVRPETFVKDTDGNETAPNIGDGIAANVEHTLSWKVSSDWKTDLAKVKFEILTREDGVLPLDLITIPAVNGRSPEVTCSYNAPSSTCRVARATRRSRRAASSTRT